MKKPKAKKPASRKGKKHDPKQAAARKLLDKAPDAVNEVRAAMVVDIAPAKPKEKIPAGLVEVKIKDTHLTLLGMQNQDAIPTLEQRVAMAKRLNEVGPSLPRYVKQVINSTTSIGDAEMGKSKEAIPGTGLTVKDIEKEHAKSVAEANERMAQEKKDAAKKAKDEEAKRKAESTARKKMKGKDVTPKAEHHSKKPEAPAAKKGADPKAQVKGISAPPPKPKASMNPGAVPKGGFTKDNKPATSGELIRARIGEHKMTDDAIAAEVRKLWPGRTTAVSDIRWNRSQMQKAGVKNVPEPVEGSTVPGKKK